MKREKFGSRLGFILVSAGCAIGLGNVWKFPYICGQYGGAIFILIYLAFLIMLGLPILMSEFAIGRSSEKGVSMAFDALERPGSRWHKFKWMNMAGNYLLMMFYTMVAGWMLYYSYKMITGNLSGLDPDGVAGAFGGMMGRPGLMIGWMIVVVCVAFGICGLGLRNGVEKITKVIMIGLLVLMVALAIHSIVLKGAGEGIRFYLVPNLHNIEKQGLGKVVFAAMTHAFFTLGLGVGSMLIFGSYMDKERSLLSEAGTIVALDTFVAVTAGFIIIPACFAYGVEPNSGPPLLFITLPNIFNNMAGGRIWGTLFFVFMSFASLSTVIAVFENIISFYIDMAGWTRKKAVALNIVLMSILSLPAIVGYNVLAFMEPLGKGTSLMDLEDFILSYNILPLGCLIFVLFCVKKNGWGYENFKAEVEVGKGPKLPGFLQGYMTYVLPLIIVIVYLWGYYDFFRGQATKTIILWMCIAVVLLMVVCGIIFLPQKKSQN